MDTSTRRTSFTALALTTLALMLISTAAYAQDPYPEATGYVNDFAQLLTFEEGKALNDELAVFEEKTSVEIAVVTVTSLDGRTIEDYTRGLAETWGVGKRGKNNGVVFLVAPNEREMRIEVADGVSSILTNSRANWIRDYVILPRLKEGNMAQGIIEGTHEIMRSLDTTPVPVLEVTSPPSSESRGVNLSLLVPIFFGTLTFGALGLFWYVSYETRKRVLETISDLSSKFGAARNLAKNPDVRSKSRREIEALWRKFSPKTKISSSSKVNWNDAESDLKGIEEQLTYMVETMKEDVAFAKEARREGPRLLKKIPSRLKAMKKRLAKGQRSKAAVRYLNTAQTLYGRARDQSSSSSNINWLLVYVLLMNSNSRLVSAQEAHINANSDGSNGSWGDSADRPSSYESHDSGSPSSYGFGSNLGFGGGGGFSGGGTTGKF